jgi:hypothetical protein
MSSFLSALLGLALIGAGVLQFGSCRGEATPPARDI